MLWVPQPKTTHRLKMEVRDQSSDGQVGESEKYLMDGGLGIWTRNWAWLWFVHCFNLSRMMYSTSADTFMSSVSRVRHDSEGYVGLCCAAMSLCAFANHSIYSFHLYGFGLGAWDVYWPAVTSLCCTWLDADRRARLLTGPQKVCRLVFSSCL